MRRLAALALAVLAVLPTGCASFRDPCGGGCGGGLLSNCRLFNGSLFRRSTVVAAPMVSDGCAEPYLSVPVEGAPMLGPAELLPAPAGVELAPAPLEAGELEPIPAPAAEATPTSGLSSPNQKTLYETYKPPGGTITSRRSVPATTPRAPGSTTLSNPAAPLLDLPPLTAAAGPEADAQPSPPAAADPVPVPAPVAVAATVPAPALELPPDPADTGPVSLAPGIARFKVVEPQLAGGSLPNASGWSFLAEKGYRTALDLRERAEVQPGDDAAALHAGLRYVALPVNASTIGDALLQRFNDEIAMAGGRPLFFFDDDGARAAVLWYLRLVVTEGLDEQTALREVEDLGPKVAEYWLAANVYLQNRKAAGVTAPPATTPAPAPVPAPVVEPPGPAAAPPAAAPAAGDPAGAAATDAPLAVGAEPEGFDETRWRPVAAMILTGLSLPLAFLGRSAFTGRVVRRLASLPAPARRLLSLPSKSDG